MLNLDFLKSLYSFNVLITMTSFSNICSFLLNLTTLNDPISVNIVSFLINDFLGSDSKHVRFFEKNLIEFAITHTIDDNCSFSTGFTQKNCFYDEVHEQTFVLLDTIMTRSIFLAAKSSSVKTKYLKFDYEFTDQSQTDCSYFAAHDGKIDHRTNQKALIFHTENSIRLKSDGCDIRMFNIKQILGQFMLEKSSMFDIYASFLGIIESSKDMNFDLLHFKSLSLSFESLKRFISDLNYFKLLDDLEITTKEGKLINVEDTNTLRASYFLKYLKDKFSDDFRRSMDKSIDEYKTYITTKLLFDECCNYITIGLISKKIFLPIEGIYTTDFYLVWVYPFIKKFIYPLKKDSDCLDSNKKTFLVPKTFEWFRKNFESFQRSIFNEICEFKYVHKYFSKIIGKNIENLVDYMEVEKIICDYFNTFVFVQKKINKTIQSDFVEPLFIDGFNCRIVKAIEIIHNYPSKYIRIKAYDFEGEEVVVKEDFDYFKRTINKICFSTERINERNINEIEILAFDGIWRKRFNIDQCLSGMPVQFYSVF